MFSSVGLMLHCRSVLTLQEGYCFQSNQNCCCTTEWRQYLICSAHSHRAGLICGLACCTLKSKSCDRFLQNTPAVQFHFIYGDQSLNNSKQSHSLFGVLTCLFVMLYLFEFHRRAVGKVTSKC